ncbi:MULTISPECIES: hypothetical protein [unclassified Mesorhizobium]|uniref:hypothetical protein n=1 Tax=unclassified Mesorhizobium TaxID=325217 RepID=UPI0015E2E5CF|nr:MULTISPECIES: hypothetical protein [unclassified Mesorhizobium]
MPIATIETYDHDGEHPIAASDAPFASEARLAYQTLDSGDPNAFTSPEAGAVACGRNLRPHGQGQVAAIR